MELIQAAVLGIVQGLTEFLPISSSGHLFLIPKLLGWEGLTASLTFDVALHLGTTLALILFFWRDWLGLISAFLRNLNKGWGGLWGDQKSRLLILLGIGTIPAGLLGVLFDSFFENEARNLPLVAFTTLFFGLVLFAADRTGRKNRTLESVSLTDSIFVGLGQALALVPGVSRSGITITSSLFRGLDRQTATRFSFLLATPTIIGASMFKLKDVLTSSSTDSSQQVFLVGVAVSTISGFLAIRFLLKFVQTNNFTVFVVYRVILGIALFAWVIGI